MDYVSKSTGVNTEKHVTLWYFVNMKEKGFLL